MPHICHPERSEGSRRFSHIRRRDFSASPRNDSCDTVCRWGRSLNCCRFVYHINLIRISNSYLPLSTPAMISLARSKIGFISPYSGLTTSKYFTPGWSRLSGGMSSFGISMRREFAGSSTSPSFCSAICPLRDRNQLMKNLGGVGMRRLIQVAQRSRRQQRSSNLLSNDWCRNRPPAAPDSLPAPNLCSPCRWRICPAPASWSSDWKFFA